MVTNRLEPGPPMYKPEALVTSVSVIPVRLACGSAVVFVPALCVPDSTPVCPIILIFDTVVGLTIPVACIRREKVVVPLLKLLAEATSQRELVRVSTPESVPSVKLVTAVSPPAVVCETASVPAVPPDNVDEEKKIQASLRINVPPTRTPNGYCEAVETNVGATDALIQRLKLPPVLCIMVAVDVARAPDNEPVVVAEVPNVKVLAPIFSGPLVNVNVPEVVVPNPMVILPMALISTPEPLLLLTVRLLIWPLFTRAVSEKNEPAPETV